MREESPGEEFPTFTPAEHIADGDRIPLLGRGGGDERAAPAAYDAVMSTERKQDRANGEMTISELAERTGMTVRNIRAHQTRGLLPPPVVRGRTGYYNEEHVARIELTREMQADGLNLEAIRRVLESGDGSADGDLRLHPRPARALRRRGAGDLRRRRAGRRSGGRRRSSPSCCERAEKLGIVRTLPDGRIEVISPRMLQAAAELAGLGIGAEAALGRRRRSCAATPTAPPAAFVDLFVEEIWEPFDKAGRPEQDWPTVREALERHAPARRRRAPGDVPDRDGRGGRRRRRT